MEHKFNRSYYKRTMNWSNLTVKQYQEIEQVRATTSDPIELCALTVCIVFNYTPAKVDKMPANVFLRHASKVEGIFGTTPHGEAKKIIGRFKINYNVETIKWRQYVEIQYWLKREFTGNFHLILASCAAPIFGSNKSENFTNVSERLREYKFIQVYFAVVKIINNISSLNHRFNPVQVEEDEPEEELKDDIPQPNFENDFMDKWGWIYSTTRIAEHRRISLDEAYELTAVQALSDLQFIKDLQEYEKSQIKNAQSVST